MLDAEFTNYARQLLDDAIEMRLEAFLSFARLASRFFPPYFEALGFSRAEAETMTLNSIKGIETDFAAYSSGGRENLDAWIAEHLYRVVRRAIAEFRQASHEMAAASERQAEIFRFVEIEGVDVWAKYRPARVICGDFCDGILCGDGSYLIAVGDASGKGGAAAFYAVLAVGFLRAKAADVSDPVELMRLLNQGLRARKPDSGAYVTLTLARWSPKERVLKVSNSAGCYPLRMLSEGLDVLQLDGQWLGTHEKVTPDSTDVVPAPGELVVLYSDGIPDQWKGEEQYGTERLALALARSFDLPLDELADEIFEDIDQFRDEEPLSDDQTLVLMRFCSRAI